MDSSRSVFGAGALGIDLERIEAAARHEQELVAQYVTGGAQFAPEAETTAEQPRLGIGPAVDEAREIQCDQRKAIKRVADYRRRRVVGQTQAQRRTAIRPAFGFGLPALERDRHGLAVCRGLVVAEVSPRIGA